MAIVQISRIQHRRGKKLAGSGMPQLASGELGWAIDTQELYIGNGAVSEGAPSVGNTKLLTEHDNIIDFANQYAYKPNNSSIWNNNTVVERSLQQQLDDTVSIKSFGAIGDGIADDTVAIQNAIDGLFLNGEVFNRVILWFPAGVYKISNSIKLPPFATIRGAGKDKTIISSTTSDIFETVNGSSTPGNYNNSVTTSINAVDANQARYIDISDITLEMLGNKTVLKLVDCANSKFHNIKIKGSWVTNSSSLPDTIGIALIASGIASCINNVFFQIEIDGFENHVYSDYDIKDNSWKDCIFYMANRSVSFGDNTIVGAVGQFTGPLHNIFENCKFDMINKEAIYINNGEYNFSKSNKFYNVGNDGGNPSVAVYPNIAFSSHTNISDQDFFERTNKLSPDSDTDQFYQKQYVPEILGRTYFKNMYGNEVSIGQQLTLTELLKFPMLESGTVFVDYIYSDQFNNIVREGTLEILSNVHANSVSVNDNYNYSGPDIHATALEFTAQFVDYGDRGFLPTTGNETISVLFTNTLSTNTDKFFYTLRVKS